MGTDDDDGPAAPEDGVNREEDGGSGESQYDKEYEDAIEAAGDQRRIDEEDARARLLDELKDIEDRARVAMYVAGALTFAGAFGFSKMCENPLMSLGKYIVYGVLIYLSANHAMKLYKEAMAAAARWKKAVEAANRAFEERVGQAADDARGRGAQNPDFKRK